MGVVQGSFEVSFLPGTLPEEGTVPPSIQMSLSAAVKGPFSPARVTGRVLLHPSRQIPVRSANYHVPE
jgi:hypothetical protein